MSIGDLFHKQLVAKLEALCPGQFQYFPIVLVHKEKSPPFENRDFCLINFLHLIDAVDVERSIPKKNYVGLDPVQRCVYWDKMVFKENPWPEGVTIGRNLYKRPSILFHPSLANYFRQDPAMEFWTDEELTALVLT